MEPQLSRGRFAGRSDADQYGLTAFTSIEQSAVTQPVQGADLLLGTGSETLAVVQNVTVMLDETSFTQLIG